MRKVVVNSTPLIALSHVGQLNLLRDIYGTIIIPDAVFQEISAKKGSVCEKAVTCSLDWIQVKKIQNEMVKQFYKTQLHAGEVEVMILAKEEDADLVIIDDNNAKKHAKYLELTVTGTLGVLLKAKSSGYIDKVEPIINEMQSQGIYISDKVREMCLRMANER